MPGLPSLPDTVLLLQFRFNISLVAMHGLPSLPDTVLLLQFRFNISLVAMHGLPSLPDTVLLLQFFSASIVPIYVLLEIHV